ncbi:MAG TPA: hypothetical protein VEL76_00725 [Gemmataceae bacterium]|nr:hypothetical protein [Gemmataceae bacterium]
MTASWQHVWRHGFASLLPSRMPPAAAVERAVSPESGTARQ